MEKNQGTQYQVRVNGVQIGIYPSEHQAGIAALKAVSQGSKNVYVDPFPLGANSKEVDEIFRLEYQYQRYLESVKLQEADMHPEQKRQLRHAFMGACGQLLFLMRDDMSMLDEERAVATMQGMINQVMHFILRSHDTPT